jgi:hypothetical protein
MIASSFALCTVAFHPKPVIAMATIGFFRQAVATNPSHCHRAPYVAEAHIALRAREVFDRLNQGGNRAIVCPISSRQMPIHLRVSS